MEFQKLSPTISIYTPPPSTFPQASDPTTVILCQWMGASPKSRLLESAYQKYQLLYPSARIISIRSLPSFFSTTSNTKRLKTFEPVVSAIKSDRATSPKIIVHLFSNGGALSFVDVCTVWRNATGKVLSVKAIILDSAVGDPTFAQTWEVVSMTLPKNPLLKLPVIGILLLFIGLLFFAKYIFGYQNMVQKTRNWINDWSLVDPSAKRLYVYSEEDALVGWKDVENHAQEAKKSGVEVEMMKLMGSNHVQHIVTHQKTYWDSIENLWGSINLANI